MQRQRAGDRCRPAKAERIAGIDFRVAKKLIMLGRSRRQIQVDFLALTIDQLDGVAINVVAIGDTPWHRKGIALLLRRAGLEHVGDIQKFRFAVGPREQAGVRPRAADREAKQQQDRKRAPV